MLGWKQFSAVLVLGAAVALPPVTASAQQAPAAAQARPAAAAPAAVTPAAAPAKPAMLRARDLMTPQERQAYRQAMRGARNDPARREQLRQQWRNTLRDRATARGGVFVEGPAPKPMTAKTETAKSKPVAPPRAP